MGEDKKEEGYDRVYDLIGGHGWFQWRLLLIISLQLVILTWHHIGYTFLGAVPDHWCSIDALKSTNWTTEQIKALSIPPKNDDGDEKESGNVIYQKCVYYDYNYKDLVSSSLNYEEAYSKAHSMNSTTRECDKWDFDHSLYKTTIPTEFQLVCGRRWMTATIQSSYMAGGLFGTVFFGSMSDKFFGRRKTVLISLSLVVVAGIAASFVRSYWIFLLLRFVISIGVSGSMQNCFILGMEHSDRKYRALLGILGQIPFAVGYMILPLLAFFIREWWMLQLSFGLCSLSVITYYWILPDSPRWLSTHGKEDRAVKCLLRIAKVNKMPTPSREELLEIIRPCHQHHEIPGNAEDSSTNGQPSPSGANQTVAQKFNMRLMGVARNFKNLMKTAEIRKRSLVFWTIFLTVSMVYYGLVFASNLTSDPFLMFFLSGLMEVPAYTVIVPFVSKLGRRPTTSATFIFAGICLVGFSQMPKSYESLRIILAMAAKLFISSAFAIIYLLGAELYPTEMRTTGLAVGIFMGRFGSITAPYVADLLQYVGKDFPTMIFGASAIIAGVISLALPETKVLEMTDQLYEVEKQAAVAAEERMKEKRQSIVDKL